MEPDAFIEASHHDIHDGDGGFQEFAFFDYNDGVSHNDTETTVASVVLQIEQAQLVKQLPLYREAIKWNPESRARLTEYCFILQDWDARRMIIQVRS